MMNAIRILGLDPGLRRTGWGVIAVEGSRLTWVAHGVITSADKAPLAERLLSLFDGIGAVIAARAKSADVVAVMALMETPAIISGLLLARAGGSDSLASRGGLLHETFLNGSVILLLGSFLIGLVAGKPGLEPIAPVYDVLFRGMLCLFLLDMGLIAARRLRETRNLTWRLIALGIALPVLQGVIGVSLGTAIGLDVPTAAVLGILAASASYIAVPAVLRHALPEVNPALYMGMSLGITFPFNIILGIPLYAMIAKLVI